MKFSPSFSFLSSFSSFFALIFNYIPLLMTGVEEIMCDLTCTWTKRLVTWLVFGPNDLWLDLTSDQMTCDLTWTCTEMTCDLTWTCKEMTCDLTWTCKKWLAAISDAHTRGLWYGSVLFGCSPDFSFHPHYTVHISEVPVSCTDPYVVSLSSGLLAHLLTAHTSGRSSWASSHSWARHLKAMTRCRL